MQERTQERTWENEYKNPKLVSGSTEPQTSMKDFLRWLRRERGVPLENLRILDLGCGNGKNSNYIANLDNGNRAIGIDISETALIEARKNAELAAVSKQVEYIKQSIGHKLPFAAGAFDLLLDVTASNSLTEAERTMYLTEAHRVLKPGGYFFVRALCKDGDKNAQNLLKTAPGKERDTYIMPEIGLLERVFSKEDLVALYSTFFTIHHLEKETHYTQFAGRSYKRNFWVAYLQKA